jgi:hypothetical protein
MAQLQSGLAASASQATTTAATADVLGAVNPTDYSQPPINFKDNVNAPSDLYALLL